MNNKDHVKEEQQSAEQCKCEQQASGHDCGCHCSEEPTDCIRVDEEKPVETEGNRSMEEQELENRLLRLQADFDNFRKRTARERLEQAAFVEAALVTHLLPVLDNFDRALANLPEAAEASWAEGVQLVHKQLLDVLEQQGLEHIDCRQPFDPNVHEAVMRETCDDDEADGTILQELQRGYSYKGKLLRPSMVKVATKG